MTKRAAAAEFSVLVFYILKSPSSEFGVFIALSATTNTQLTELSFPSHYWIWNKERQGAWSKLFLLFSSFHSKQNCIERRRPSETTSCPVVGRINGVLRRLI